MHLHRHLGSQLSEMENVIEKMMEADLVDFAVQDIRYRLEASQNATTSEEGPIESEVCMESLRVVYELNRIFCVCRSV